MSELRWDPLDRAWALVASERGLRPTDFMPPPRETRRDAGGGRQGPCPFCFILGGQGPATRIYERRSAEDRVLVVANRFPALSVESPGVRQAVGPYDRIDGVGAHEVVIETTDHETPFRHLPVDQLTEVVIAWRDRASELMKDRRLQHVAIFKNDGPRAGATLEHAHSQVIATPVRPARVVRQLESASRHWRDKERCLVCDVLAFELEQQHRVLELSPMALTASAPGAAPGGFVAWCPYASRHAFEVWLAPRRHSWSFGALGVDEARDLAVLLKRVLVALDQALMSADLNLVLSLAPSTTSFARGADGLAHVELWWHWHLEIVPRLAQYGGFELGTGVIINPTPPEDAAAHLRGLLG